MQVTEILLHHVGCYQQVMGEERTAQLVGALTNIVQFAVEDQHGSITLHVKDGCLAAHMEVRIIRPISRRGTPRES